MVENVRFQTRIDRPDELIVRCGGLSRRTLVVIAADEVAVIVPGEQRFRVKHRPQAPTRERLSP